MQNIEVCAQNIKPKCARGTAWQMIPYSGKALLKCFIIVYCFADIGSKASVGLTLATVAAPIYIMFRI